MLAVKERSSGGHNYNRMSQVKQNYVATSEAGVNKQINLELYASYVYQSMACYFDRDDVALAGFHKFFKKSSDEEREHAEHFMKYQNQRGGRILLQNIEKPDTQEWSSGLAAFQATLALEKSVNQSLLDLHALATQNNDSHLADFLESNYLTEQVESIKEIATIVSKLTHGGPGLGEYLIDRDFSKM